MSIPTFFNPANAHDPAYQPSMRMVYEAAEEAVKKDAIAPAISDKVRTVGLGIDLQCDFGFPTGSLYVAGRSGTGAMDDAERIARMTYENLSIITDWLPTFDTHVAFQIFFASFWRTSNGEPVQPFIEISAAEVRDGKYVPAPWTAQFARGSDGKPNYQWVKDYALWYCEQLEQKGKFKLFIWPEHCLLGTMGHALMGVIAEARMYHAYTRRSSNNNLVKGDLVFTENYSVLSPEILTSHDGRAVGQRNTRMLEVLLNYDNVVLFGQAGSHCVNWSIDDILGYILSQDPALAKKVYVVKDCMSPVVIPGGPDFTQEMLNAFDRFEQAGMHLVESTTPMRDWPDFKVAA